MTSFAREFHEIPPHKHHHHPTLAVDSYADKPVSLSCGKDPGGIGFMYEIGGSEKGFVSCTETLGFESSDERSSSSEDCSYASSDDDQRVIIHTAGEFSSTARKRAEELMIGREKTLFPPPLTSLSRLGQPSFVLRPLRRDGRLEIKVVRIKRPEILCATRENGRLTLHLVRDLDEEKINHVEAEEKLMVGDQQGLGSEDKAKEVEGLVEVEEEETLNTEADGGGGEGEAWMLSVKAGGGAGGEGMRRCYDGHRHHHPHPLHAWRQHCVTTG